MHIRRAVAEDASELAALRWGFRSVAHGTLDESEQAFVERCTTWMRARLSGVGSWAAWIAEDDTRAVGQIWVQLVEKLPNPTGEREHHAYISNLYVQPSARGGVGTRLLETCLTWLVEREVDAILLWPSPSSRSLYERHGFTFAHDIFVRSLG